MQKVILFYFSFLLGCISYSQTQISGIINTYTDVISINTSTNSIDVTAITNFVIGDMVFIIQMKGASIDQTQSNILVLFWITEMQETANILNIC